MIEPKASRPHWPDATQKTTSETTGLKSWPWALERLEKSHNYWIATSRPGSRPHLMLVWVSGGRTRSGSAPARVRARPRTSPPTLTA